MKTTGTIISIATLFGMLFVMPMFSQVHAGTLKFEPSTITTNSNQTFTLDIIVDTEDKEVLGVDALFEYDADLLEVESITDGEFLEIGIKEFSEPGKVYVAGVVPNPGEAVVGEGVLATVQFKAKSPGNDTVKYICETGETNESNISENSTDAPDLIQCSLNGEAAVVIDGGGSTTPVDRGGGTTPPELPRSGVLEDLLVFAIVGGVLLAIGAGARFLFL